MKQEEIELYMRDICSRIMYGLKMRRMSYSRSEKPDGTVVWNENIADDTYDKSFAECNDDVVELCMIDVANQEIHFYKSKSIFKDFGISIIDKSNILRYGNLTYKPYLRSMSSMTAEESKEYYKTFWYRDESTVSNNGEGRITLHSFDWLNEHHFDYRGLIEKGLALEAPEGMYE